MCSITSKERIPESHPIFSLNPSPNASDNQSPMVRKSTRILLSALDPPRIKGGSETNASPPLGISKFDLRSQAKICFVNPHNVRQRFTVRGTSAPRTTIHTTATTCFAVPYSSLRKSQTLIQFFDCHHPKGHCFPRATFSQGPLFPKGHFFPRATVVSIL